MEKGSELNVQLRSFLDSVQLYRFVHCKVIQNQWGEQHFNLGRNGSKIPTLLL